MLPEGLDGGGGDAGVEGGVEGVEEGAGGGEAAGDGGDAGVAGGGADGVGGGGAGGVGGGADGLEGVGAAGVAGGGDVLVVGGGEVGAGAPGVDPGDGEEDIRLVRVNEKKERVWLVELKGFVFGVSFGQMNAIFTWEREN